MSELVSDGAMTVIGLSSGVAVKLGRKRKRKNSRELTSLSSLSRILHQGALCAECLKVTHVIDRRR